MRELVPAVAIGHLPVPPEVVGAMLRGAWRMPQDQTALRSIFPEPPVAGAALYSLDGMLRENQYWWSDSDEQLSRYGVGVESRDGGEAISPASTMLFGDLGHDMPMAFDYSVSSSRPRVLYLPSTAPSWVEVAGNVSDFLARMRIDV